MIGFADIQLEIDRLCADNDARRELAARLAARLDGPEQERFRVAIALVDFIVAYVRRSVALGAWLETAPAEPRFASLAGFTRTLAGYWADSFDVVPDHAGLIGRLDDAYFTARCWNSIAAATGRPSLLGHGTFDASAHTAHLLLGRAATTQLDLRVRHALEALDESAAAGALVAAETAARAEWRQSLHRILSEPAPVSVPPTLEGFIDSATRSAPAAPKTGDPPGTRPDPEGDGRIYDVWFGTNRAPVNPGDLSKGFANERDPQGTVRYGQCSVAIPRSPTFGSLGTSWLKRWRKLRFGDDHYRLRTIEVFGSEKAFCDELRAELEGLAADSRDVVVYIHGYNVSFEEAALRAAQIGFDLKVTGATAFFSWPSMAAVEGYAADIARTEASEQQLAHFLETVSGQVGANRVHIIAHSMGNRGFARAISRITAYAARTTGIKFGQIILAAPDIDVDLFRDLAKVYPRISERTTMYISAKDKALGLSSWLQDSDRAGYTPPVTVVAGIDTVEVTAIDLTVLGHGYFAQAEAVLYDMKDLIDDNKPPERRSRVESRELAGAVYWAIRA